MDIKSLKPNFPTPSVEGLPEGTALSLGMPQDDPVTSAIPKASIHCEELDRTISEFERLCSNGGAERLRRRLRASGSKACEIFKTLLA